MDDFLDERDQWEALKTWLKQNGPWIVAGVVIGIGGLFGMRWWENHVTVRAQTAATRYSDMLEALTRNDRTRAEQLADTLHKEFGSTPYADHAQLALARTDVDAGKLDEAAKRLGTVAQESEDEELRHIAQLRLARVQLTQNKPDEALATLGRGESGAFTSSVEEARGDALLAKGDAAGALAAYRRAAEAMEPGQAEQGLLQLKINDLAAPTGETAAGNQAAAGDQAAATDQAAANDAPKDSE